MIAEGLCELRLTLSQGIGSTAPVIVLIIDEIHMTRKVKPIIKVVLKLLIQISRSATTRLEIGQLLWLREHHARHIAVTSVEVTWLLALLLNLGGVLAFESRAFQFRILIFYLLVSILSVVPLRG